MILLFYYVQFQYIEYVIKGVNPLTYKDILGFQAV